MTRCARVGVTLEWLGLVGLLAACDNPAPDTRSAISAIATVQAQAPAARSQTISDSRRSAVVDAAARVAPAVVSINVVRHDRRVTDAWDLFFVPRNSGREIQGSGSGFIVSNDGLVITNQHVTEGAERVVVTTRDGTDYPATILGEDDLTDIAVVKITGPTPAPVALGRSDDLMIGEWVVAFGNPFGYLLGNTEPTVSVGVVSAVGRNIFPAGDQSGVYVGMIQTDAAINPGNSGGPLANAAGEVVGVNSFIFSSSGGSVGIGFAIPIERALRVANELKAHGTVRRAWVGLDVRSSDGTRDWKSAGGLRVTALAPGGPAARAGIQMGDVLLSAAGRPLRTFLDWEGVKLDIGVGDTLPVVIKRGEDNRRVRLTVEDLPTTKAEKVAVLGDIKVVTVTPAIRQERKIQSEGGAMIYAIGDATRDATGLAAGDVILQVNRQTIREAEEMGRLFKASAGRAPIRVYFERGGSLAYTDFYVR